MVELFFGYCVIMIILGWIVIGVFGIGLFVLKLFGIK